MNFVDLHTYGQNKVSFYLALEQYRLPQIEKDEFFLWDIPPSLIIGRNQLLRAEINLDFATKEKIEIFRRPSGGGAVFADEGCFMYTFLTKEKNKEMVYRRCLDKFLLALKALNLDVYFSGRNDLMFQNKKFSGTAFMQTKDGSILHGTFLYDTNLEMLVSALMVDGEKIASKGIKSVAERVVNLKPYLPFDKAALMNYLGTYLGENKTSLAQADFQHVKEIEKKYLSTDWIWGKDPKFSFQNRKRYPFGLLEVFILAKNNRIKEINLQGDFFHKKPLETFYQHFLGQSFTKEALMEVLSNHPISEYIENANNNDLLELIFKGGEA